MNNSNGSLLKRFCNWAVGDRRELHFTGVEFQRVINNPVVLGPGVEALAIHLTPVDTVVIHSRPWVPDHWHPGFNVEMDLYLRGDPDPIIITTPFIPAPSVDDAVACALQFATTFMYYRFGDENADAGNPVEYYKQHALNPTWVDSVGPGNVVNLYS
ncbi:MAG: hypothetical protein CL678_15920 [Bdellovibrionaceae bacterium]|nr:hypothetical protein [Pseudobdellovibrionaceae bacterium]